MSIYEWFSLIIDLLSLLSLFFLAVQVLLSVKHGKEAEKRAQEMHEEQRRVQTLGVLNNWSRSIKKETRLSEMIVEELDLKQCKQLYTYTSFNVDEKIYNNICQMCSRYKPNCTECSKTNNTFTVSGPQLTELRGHVTNYLNSLETVAIAWQQGIVDKKMVETQFAYLYNPGSKTALENYRKVAGNGKSFPVLAEFYNEIKKNNEINVKQKKEQ